jgi:serine/threonine protein kinase
VSDLVGQSIGRQRILEQLGQGGTATVFRAYDTRLGRQAALKSIDDTLDSYGPGSIDFGSTTLVIKEPPAGQQEQPTTQEGGRT